MSPSTTPPPAFTVRRQALWATGLAALVIALGAGLLAASSSLAVALRWAALTSLVAGLELQLLWRHLAENRRRGESDLLPTLGAANFLTLGRGLLLALLAGFLALPPLTGWQAWLPVLVYTIASSADGFDGYLARVRNQSTLLGVRLDVEFDSLGALIVVTLGAWTGQTPVWFVLAGLLRYLFLGGLAWRRRRNLPVADLTPSVHRRIVAAFTMSFLSITLWPMVYPPTLTLAAALILIPLLLSFGRDWLVVSHRVDPASPVYQRRLDQVMRIATRWAPLPLRLTAVGGIIALLAASWTGASIPSALALPGLPWPQVTSLLTLALAALGLPMVALGWAGRAGALALIIPTAAYALNLGLDWLSGLALAAQITLLYTGSGWLSLWQPENRLLMQRAGSPRKVRSS